MNFSRDLNINKPFLSNLKHFDNKTYVIVLFLNKVGNYVNINIMAIQMFVCFLP